MRMFWWCCVMESHHFNSMLPFSIFCSLDVSLLLWCHNWRYGAWNHQPHVVYSTVYSGTDEKNQSSASLAFVRGIHRWPANSPHKGPVTRKCFHLMTSSCEAFVLLSWLVTACNNFIGNMFCIWILLAIQHLNGCNCYCSILCVKGPLY